MPKKTKKTALSTVNYAIEQAEIEFICRKFQTTSNAATEIRRLWFDNEKLRQKNNRLNFKRGRGRPKDDSRKINLDIVEVFPPELLSAYDVLIDDVHHLAHLFGNHTGQPQGNNRGRPRRLTKQERVVFLKRVADEKMRRGNPKMTDKSLLTALVEEYPKAKRLRSDKKESLVNKICAGLKYYRDDVRKSKQRGG